MISWTRFYKKSTGIVAFGFHDTGAFCIMDSRTKDRIAYALVHMSSKREGILSQFSRSKQFYGTAAIVTEQLDQYIAENKRLYLYEWLEGLHDYNIGRGFREYTP